MGHSLPTPEAPPPCPPEASTSLSPLPQGWGRLPAPSSFPPASRGARLGGGGGGQEPCWLSRAFLAKLLFPQIITSEEAERRGQIYDRQGATYLFDLDYVEDVYTVDAAYYGNISHFVNHSVGTPQAGGGSGGAGGAPPHPPALLFCPV